MAAEAVLVAEGGAVEERKVELLAPSGAQLRKRRKFRSFLVSARLCRVPERRVPSSRRTEFNADGAR